MTRIRHHLAGGRRWTIAISAAAATGVFVALLVGVALARSFTLALASDATLTNQSGMTERANLVVNARGLAVYYLTGDSPRHPKCTRANGCFGFWAPVTVSSRHRLTKGAGVRGKLGVWRRGHLLQATLAGRPLYVFTLDRHARQATGEGVKSFGGTWHVFTRGARTPVTTTPTPTTTGATPTTTSTTSTTTTSTTTTTTPSCTTPYCY